MSLPDVNPGCPGLSHSLRASKHIRLPRPPRLAVPLRLSPRPKPLQIRVHRSVSLAHLALFDAETGDDARVCAHHDAVALLLALARRQQPQTLACYARRLHTRGARQGVCAVCARARSSRRALRPSAPGTGPFGTAGSRSWTWSRELAQVVSQTSGWRRAGAAPTDAVPRSGCAIAPTRQPRSPPPRPTAYY